jgi:DNA repair protein RecO (recombination protein O)
MLGDLLLQLGRLEEVVRQHEERKEALAVAVQGTVHLLALGGFALPLQRCVRTGAPLIPPLGDWSWRCSLLPAEGLAVGSVIGAGVTLNASELALLQRLPRPQPPRSRDGGLLGPERVWLHLLELVELWCCEHLGRSPRAFRLLRWDFERMSSDRSSPPPPRDEGQQHL